LFAPMNARASHYSGCSAISHSRLKELRGLEGKRSRKPRQGLRRPNYYAEAAYVGARNSPPSQPAAVRDFIGSTSSTTR
jgi:hypothetical protein